MSIHPKHSTKDEMGFDDLERERFGSLEEESRFSQETQSPKPFSHVQENVMTPEGALAVAGKIIQTLRNEGLDPKSDGAFTVLSVVLKAVGS